MRILSIGTFTSCGVSNTCLHRTWALERMGEVERIDTSFAHKYLGYRIANRLFVRYRIPIRYRVKSLNRAIVRKVEAEDFDVVWIDKGVFVEGGTLRKIKQLRPNCTIVGYSPDNMVERHNQTRVYLESLPYYDYQVTTKSYTVEALKGLGAKRVIFVDNAYEETFHHPYDLTAEERARLGAKIGFIGAWEQERCESILFLARNGVPVRVFGGGKWLEYKGMFPCLTIENKGFFSEDYCKALSAFDISLCFLRKINFDLQTTRTMEIPACGSMLLAERTEEHERLFAEGREAVFFSNNEELLEKCRYYLAHEEERKQIARSGRERCLKSGYSNYERIKGILTQIGYHV